jgi:hypothetical protein
MQLTGASQPNSWQEQCTKELLACAAANRNRHGTWAKQKKILEGKHRIIIADVELQGADLQEFDFSRCYVIRTDFSRANLTKAKFSQAVVKETTFQRARISATDFSDADVSGANFYDVAFDKATRLNWLSQVTDANRARPALRQAVDDHRYIADLRKMKAGLLVRLWNVSTKYGTSLERLFIFSVALNIVFGSVYYVLSAANPKLFKPSTVHSSLEMLALALQRFLNASSAIDADNLAVSYLFILNTFCGFTVLGMFVALLSKKLVATLR